MNDQKVLVLIDCNNFFVSCERLFHPDLEGKPIVVLSSNDGCAISRSQEAKTLGIPMGAPAFKYRSLFETHRVHSFSANFELYGNISRRITSLLRSITPQIEIYSVDESFLDITSLQITDYEAWGAMVREHILHWVGIPVSIGIAPTKTLAKLANLAAKKQPELGGVLSFMQATAIGPWFDQTRSDSYLAQTAVEDVWGIGYRLAPKLRATGLGTALSFARAKPKEIQKLRGIQGRQTQAELTGISCFPLELYTKAPQSISVSRTFGHDTNDQHIVEAALASFVAKGAYKLRRSKQLTASITLFLTTSKHKPAYQAWKQYISLIQPTADTEALLTATLATFRTLYMTGKQYHRAGIILSEFTPDRQLQTDFFGSVDTSRHERQQHKAIAVDSIKNKYGSSSIRNAAELLSDEWQPMAKIRSPRYVSNWQELPIIRPTNA